MASDIDNTEQGIADELEKNQFIRRRLANEEINMLPMTCYLGPLTVVNSEDQFKKILPALRDEPILGFDTETKPCFRKGDVHLPSIMQLATENHIYILQLDYVPLNILLGEIMANPDQIKAGVAIGEDMRQLSMRFPFTPHGHIDLSKIAEKNNIASRGLRTMLAAFFGQRISKGAQCSNWSNPKLTQKQLIYAATDAWIGRKLYLRMLELGLLQKL